MKKIIIIIISVVFTTLSLNGQIVVSPQNNVTIGSTENSLTDKLFVKNNDQENAVRTVSVINNSSRYFRRGLYNYLQIHTNDQYVYGTDNNVTISNSGTIMGHGAYNLLWVDADIDRGYASRNIISSHSNAGNSKLYGVHSSVDNSISTSNDVYSGYFTGSKVFIGHDLIIQASYGCNDCGTSGTNSIANSLSQLGKLIPQKVEYKNSENEKSSFDFDFKSFQKEFPNLSHKVTLEDDTEGFAINYIGLVPVMVAAINEQTENIEELENIISVQDSKIQYLNDRINKIEQLINRSHLEDNDVVENEIKISPNPTRNTSSNTKTQ